MTEFDIDENGVLRQWNGKESHVIIPPHVKEIGDDAFARCKILKSIEIPTGVTSIGEAAFLRCENLTNIVIPEGVRSIGQGAFVECTSLTSIDIPDSVTSIEKYAFYACTNLKNIVIPKGVTSIELGTFCRCTSLISIELPEGITSIGNYAFRNCTSLECIAIPQSLRHVHHSAFPHNIPLICDNPDHMHEVLGRFCAGNAVTHSQYLLNKYDKESKYDGLKRENITTEEIEGLFNVIASGKLKNDELSQQDICHIFPGRKIDEVKQIMHHVGFDLDAFKLDKDIAISFGSGKGEDVVVEGLKDILENHLTLKGLNMFRQAVGNKSFTLKLKSKDVESKGHGKEPAEDLSTQEKKPRGS